MNYTGLIEEMKKSGKGLMSKGQYMALAETLDKLSPCNFLVFGLGEDADVWEEINKGGRTVFLEDDKEWIGKFKNKDLEIHPVEYNTRSEDYMKIGFDAEKLHMELPKDITDVEWDIIFVDGPLGHNPPRPFKGPGRMKSIYAAHSLLGGGGVCVVDDMGRIIESVYAHHFFGSENLYGLVEGKVGFFTKGEKYNG